MKDCCLELLARLDECMKDSEFQIIIALRFLKTLNSYMKMDDEDGKQELDLRSALHDK